MVNKKYVATNRIVEREELNDFIRPRHHGVLLTSRRDGWPQSSLVSMGLDDPGDRTGPHCRVELPRAGQGAQSAQESTGIDGCAERRVER